MVVGEDGINTLPSGSTAGVKNLYREILEALDLFEKKVKADKVTVEDLKKLGVGPVVRAQIRSWIVNYEVPDGGLLDLPKEEVEREPTKVPVSVEALRKKAEEEALKWDLEHSNNLYDRYKLLKDKDLGLLMSKVRWSNFGEERKILVLAYYVMEALKQGSNMVTLANIRKPVHFYYQDKKKLRFNETAFKEFMGELGLDPEEPITGEDLAVFIVKRFGYTEESLKGFYEEIARDLIKPDGMRLPPCIEALAFRPLFYEKKGEVRKEALKVLASWIKYYSKGYSTGRIEKEGDPRILLFDFIVSKLYGDVIDVTEQAEIIQRFKKFYDEAKPFKCSMVEEVERATGYKVCSLKCPFVAPLNRVEEVLAKAEEVTLYGSDYIEIKVGNNRFLEENIPSPDLRSKLVKRFTGFLSVLYADPFIGPDEALEILKALLQRARTVQNYLSPLVAVEEWFKEEMERLLEDGALPWELKAKDRPFLCKNKMVLYVHKDLIAADLMGAVGLEKYTVRKLLEDLKRLPNSPIVGISSPIKVKRDSYTDEMTKARFWMVSVKWLEDHGIEVKERIPTVELEEEEPEPTGGLDLTPLERLIYQAVKEEEMDIGELIEFGERAGKPEEEVTRAIATLMNKGLVDLNGGKVRAVIRGEADE